MKSVNKLEFFGCSLAVSIIFSWVFLKNTDIIANAYTVKFTNIKCVSHDKHFVDFRQCILKVVGRGRNELSLHAELYQVPVNNVTLHTQLLKRASGYRPFMFNRTLDFCAFMARRKSNPALNFLIGLISETSNINHTCPYNHDIIIKKFGIYEKPLALIPLPGGEYLVRAKVAAYNNLKADVSIYFNLAE